MSCSNIVTPIAWIAAFALIASGPSGAAEAQQPKKTPASIRVDAAALGRPLSRYLTGACIEDVNHEIYGGLYSQMLFGESFQEPAAGSPVKGFTPFGGEWGVDAGVLSGGDGDGFKLISSAALFADGEVGVDVYLPALDAPGSHTAGLIVRVTKPGVGANRFDGYEVTLDPGRKVIRLGRHQQDYKPLKETPFDIPVDRWVSLSVRLAGGKIEVSLDGKAAAQFDDPRPLGAGTVGVRQWLRTAKYRNFWIKAGEQRTNLPFDVPTTDPIAVSGMWAPIVTGNAVLGAAIEKDRPLVGVQAQRVAFLSGTGEAGIENRGLNRQGLAFLAGKPYEGTVWIRSQKPAEVFASAESPDGARGYARAKITVAGGDEWRRYGFALTPNAADPSGRFSLRLTSPGSVVVGYAFLQPGEWGRFNKLPVRRDVVEGLIDQGVTVLRYGGSMVNAPEYRWKKMVGPRDRRPPYRGHWYPQSSNGWGMIEFLHLCEAAGFLAIPDFNIDESAEDMSDFIEYANGPGDSAWGRRRVADGHPAPYNLRHIELGNEEKVDDAYYAKFERLATTLWAKDRQLVLVVGDFQYDRPITDPMSVEKAASGVTSLAGHKRILDLARKNNREVWFDIHVWTDGVIPTPTQQAYKTYVDAIERLADGAKHHVVVFELNANNHEQRRALSNARAIVSMTADGRLPVVLSANGLQPDGQNDNGWDQGLLFLNPTKVWLQPPGYVTQMISRNYLPVGLDAKVDGGLVATATRSADGKCVVLQVVNTDADPRQTKIRLDNFTPVSPTAQVQTLAAPLTAHNPADAPTRIVPSQSQWQHTMKDGEASYVFPPYSFTIIRID